MKFTDPIFSLGDLYVSDFIQDGQEPRAGTFDLSICIDQRYGAARLTNITPAEAMYGKYWYRSGTNQTMTNELKDIVQSITKHHVVKENDVWIDIGCNDGTLLSFVPENTYRIGVDPADDSFTAESKNHANEIVQNFFSYNAVKHIKAVRERKAKVITAIAMFYDLERPKEFLDDIYKALDDDGLFVVQMSYTPLMIEQLAFDNICHEHVYYWSLTSIKKLLRKSHLKVIACKLNDTNGGSFRLFIKKAHASTSTFANQPYRDVCQMEVNALLQLEKRMKIDQPQAWRDFYHRVDDLRQKTVSFIRSEKANGKIICGYGASTKGNTLLQYFGLDHNDITAIAERSPYKFGLKTVGTNIPILPEQEVRDMKPDYMLVLPWHFIHEFKIREHEYLQNGGKFIVPCPTFQII
jgi:2-polyprenyl-3-methyl-5-hydroxy-6-metoxy-1,4-benzoquinol methylase